MLHVEKWMKEVAPFYRDPGKVEGKYTVLLIVDMENYFASPSGQSFLPDTEYIVPNIKKLLTFFREHKLPVIYTAHQHLDPSVDGGMLAKWWGSSIIENTLQADICETLKPTGERVIKKRRYSAFYQTDLELLLRGMNIENLIITGVMTNLCCETHCKGCLYEGFPRFLHSRRKLFCYRGNAPCKP